MKVTFVRALSIMLISIMFVGCSGNSQKQTKQESKKKPNVVFFIADDMYPWMFNNTKAGQKKNGTIKNLTPAIDRLAKEGVWLDNMTVVSPVCTPSRYNSLTGTYASRAVNHEFTDFTKANEGQTVIQWNSHIVPGKIKTMGNYFQDMGYKTGFVGKNHVIESLSQMGEDARPNLDADPLAKDVKAGLEHRYSELQKDIKNSGFDYADKLYHDNPNWLGIRALAYQNMDWIAEGGVEFIDKYSNKDEPFMLYIATTLPHGPLDPAHSWLSDRRITAKGIIDKAPTVFPQDKGELSKADLKLIENNTGLEPSIRMRNSLKNRVADAGLSGTSRENVLWLDDAVTALLDELEKTGELDNTIFVFFNDHGQDSKGSLYEGGVNSQCIIWKKGGFKVGNNMESIVSNVDFLPTLIDLVGGDSSNDKFDGSSFASALEGKPYKERTSVYHELGYSRAIVKDGFKYYAIRYPEWAMNKTPEERQVMLDEYTAMRESYGEHGIATDASLPYGQLELTPGGGGAEHNAYINMPNFTDPDQFYDLKNDPKEENNLINDPKYADQIKAMKKELKEKYLDKLPGKYNL
ncbi:MAG: sulfatase-like hydrolase/transferase [Chlamydiia bacterium]|nr:sulfatase-like hydrolase/transferase [Chlamydiia bacterium]